MTTPPPSLPPRPAGSIAERVDALLRAELAIHAETGAHIGFHGDEPLLRLALTCLACLGVGEGPHAPPGGGGAPAGQFIAAGTGAAVTTLTVARCFPGLPCFTCEPQASAREQAARALAGLPQVVLSEGQSPAFLNELLLDAERRAADTVLWLDAHGGLPLPLTEEVRIVTAALERGYLLINDFQVPFRPQFGFGHRDQKDIGLDLIKERLAPRHRYRVVLPTYREGTSPFDPLRGFVLIEWGHAALPPPLARLLAAGPYSLLEVDGTEAAQRLGSPERSLQRAAAALVHGKLPSVEAICSVLLARDPQDAAALELLGRLAARLGLDEAAWLHLRRARDAACRPGQGHRAALRSALLALASFPAELPARAAPRAPEPPAQRYLVVKAYGFGLGADLIALLGALLLAEVTGRTPITHWGDNSLYAAGGGGPTDDAFRLYFEPINPLTIQDLPALDGRTAPRVYPPKWRGHLHRGVREQTYGAHGLLSALHLLSRPEEILVSDYCTPANTLTAWLLPGQRGHGWPLPRLHRDLVRRYLRPRALLQQAVEDFHQRHLQGAPYVAAHIRGTDKIREQGHLQQLNDRYPQAIERALAALGPGARLFLLTDSEAILERCRARFGPRLVVTPGQRNHGAEGVHYTPRRGRVRLGLEVLRDMYLAARADHFIGNGGSSVSALIEFLKDWPEGRCQQLDPNWLKGRFIYWPMLDSRARDAPFLRF